MRKFFFIIILYFSFLNTIKSEFFINETSISNDYHETLFNYYALKFYKMTNIKIYIDYFLSSETDNIQIIKEELEGKLNDLFSFYNKKTSKILVGVFSVNRGIVKFKHNFKELNSEILEKINENFFKYHLESINYVLEKGFITKVIDEAEIIKDKGHVFSVYLSAPLSFLKGVSSYLNIDLNFDDRTLNLIRDKISLDKLIKEFNKKPLSILDDAKENEFKEKINEEDLSFEIGGSANLNFSYSFLESGEKEIDKLTGLIKDIENEDNFWKYSLSLSPFIKRKNKFSFLSSFSFLTTRDYINIDKNEGPNLKFDFLEFSILGEDYNFLFRLGDLSIPSTNVLLNDSLRGYQGSFEANFNNLIDQEFFLKIYLFYTPNEGAFGINLKSQAKISGLILNLESKGKANNIFKYIYSDAEKSNLKNFAQQLYFYSSYPLNEKIEYNLTIDYTMSNNISNILGHRTNLKYGMNFIIGQDDFLNFNLNIIHTTSSFDTYLLSSKYSNTIIPKYVTEKSAIGQYGYELNMENTLFKKRFRNFFNFSNHFKEKSFLRLISYNLYILNNFNITERLSTKANFELKNDTEEVKNFLLLSANYIFKFKFLEGDITPFYSYERSIKNNNEFFRKDRLKIEPHAKYSIYGILGNTNLSCIYDYYSLSKEHIFLIDLDNNLNFIKYLLLNKFSCLNLTKNIYKKNGINFFLNKDIILDNFLVNDFEIENFNYCLNAKFFSFFSNFLDEENSSNGYEFKSFFPFTFFNIKNNVDIELRNLNNEIYAENNYNYKISYLGKKSINDKIKISLAYGHENYLLEGNEIKDNFLRIDENGTAPKEMNSILASISSDSFSLFNKLKSRNCYKNKLKSLVHFLINKNNFINIELNSGGGLERKIFLLKNQSFLSYFYSLGLRGMLNLYNNIKIIEDLTIENHIMHYEVLKRVLLNKTTIYLSNEYLKTSLIFNFKKENYMKDKLKEYEETILGLILKGNFSTRNKLSKLSYEFEWEDYKRVKINLERIVKGEIFLNSNIYENSSGSVFQLFSSSNIFAKFEVIYKENEIKRLFLSFKGGGNAILFKGWNIINVDGTIFGYSKKANFYKETASLSIKDIQKLVDDVNITLDFKYTSNFNKRSNNFKLYSFSLGLNVNKLVINDLSLSSNILKEVYLYPPNFKCKDKTIVKGCIDICYRF